MSSACDEVIADAYSVEAFVAEAKAATFLAALLGSKPDVFEMFVADTPAFGTWDPREGIIDQTISRSKPMALFTQTIESKGHMKVTPHTK